MFLFRYNRLSVSRVFYARLLCNEQRSKKEGRHGFVSFRCWSEPKLKLISITEYCTCNHLHNQHLNAKRETGKQPQQIYRGQAEEIIRMDIIQNKTIYS